jgi:TPR repeat protein
MKFIVPGLVSFAFVTSFAATPAHADFVKGQRAMEQRDYATAMKEWRPLADTEPAAAFAVGMLYLQGFGVKQDVVEAGRWIAKAAEKGVPKAQVVLASLYIRGVGVDRNIEEALKWYRKAAEQQEVDAQVNLGVLYAHGKNVPQDYLEAAKWFERATHAGNPVAQFNLGQLYRSGKGVESDPEKAARYYQLSAKQGYPLAQTALGAAYLTGQGVKKDLVQAFVWNRLAAARGIPLARRNLDVVSGQLSPEQKRSAEQKLKTVRTEIEDVRKRKKEALRAAVLRAQKKKSGKPKADAKEEKSNAEPAVNDRLAPGND